MAHRLNRGATEATEVGEAGRLYSAPHCNGKNGGNLRFSQQNQSNAQLRARLGHNWGKTVATEAGKWSAPVPQLGTPTGYHNWRLTEALTTTAGNWGRGS